MSKFTQITFILLLAVLTTTSCSEYQKVLKSEDTKLKYETAEKLYNDGQYRKALRIFEQIVPSYVGKPQGERIIYFYANAYYQVKDYYLASYQFERFVKSYPRSDKAEEAAFLGAKSKYMESPKFSIDQKVTHEALDVLQVFINSYPESEFLPEANQMAQELRTKLEKKEFEIAKQYYTIMDYKAAIKALELFSSDFPGSVYREDALYYRFLASYELSTNSILSLMEERLKETKSIHDDLIRHFPESKYRKNSDRLMENINRELDKFSK